MDAGGPKGVSQIGMVAVSVWCRASGQCPCEYKLEDCISLVLKATAVTCSRGPLIVDDDDCHLLAQR